MKKGQASLEYMVIISIFLFLLAGAYSVSLDMGQRRVIMESQIEGERTVSLVGRSAMAAAVAGNGFYSDIFLDAYPNQTLKISGGDAAAFGDQNVSAAFYPVSPAIMQSSQAEFHSTSTIRINRSGDVIYVSPQ